MVNLPRCFASATPSGEPACCNGRSTTQKHRARRPDGNAPTPNTGCQPPAVGVSGARAVASRKCRPRANQCVQTDRGLSPANITAALDDSLRRLQTDYVDIYYSHEDDLKVPTEDTLGKYTELIGAGKIRYIAASQHSGARLQHALDTAKANNLASYIALQDHYNLITRNPFEAEQQAVVTKNGLSALPFYGLAKGFLSGKYRPGITVESVRAEAVKEYMTPTGWATIDALDAIAKNHGASHSAVALAWLRSNPAVSAPIASARTVEQLLEIIQIVKLSGEEIEQLNTASR